MRRKKTALTVLASVCLVMILGSAGFAELKVMKLGLASAPKEWGYNYAPHEVFKEILEGESHGKLLVKFYPSNQLGGVKTPVHSPADMKGLKIRTEEVAAMMEMVKSLGASPVVIDWPEMYTSLQTGVVDGFEEN